MTELFFDIHITEDLFVFKDSFRPICNISIITQVIIKILALSLAENGVIFRFSIITQGPVVRKPINANPKL